MVTSRPPRSPPRLSYLAEPGLQLHQTAALGLLLLAHLVQVLLQLGVLGLQLPRLGLQVELLLPQLRDHLLLGFPVGAACAHAVKIYERSMTSHIGLHMNLYISRS